MGLDPILMLGLGWSVSLGVYFGLGVGFICLYSYLGLCVCERFLVAWYGEI